MDISKRLKEFLDKMDVSVKHLEDEIGLANGSIRKFLNNNIKSIGSGSIEKIIAKYPSLNADWLFTGRGNMLYSEASHHISKDDDEVKELLRENRLLNQELRKARSELDKLNSQKESECRPKDKRVTTN